MKIRTKLSILFLMALGLLFSCTDKEEYYERPEWLEDPVYTVLAEKGNFTSYLKCVDRTLFVEALKGQVEFHGEGQAARKESVVLLCLEITGHQEHEEIKPIKLQSAAQRKANPVVQEALFDEGL